MNNSVTVYRDDKHHTLTFEVNERWWSFDEGRVRSFFRWETFEGIQAWLESAPADYTFATFHETGACEDYPDLECAFVLGALPRYDQRFHPMFVFYKGVEGANDDLLAVEAVKQIFREISEARAAM